MLKELFEQFIADSNTRCSVLHGYLDKTVYHYINDNTGVKMNVLVNTPIKYSIPVMQELIHTGYLSIISIGIEESTIC